MHQGAWQGGVSVVAPHTTSLERGAQEQFARRGIGNPIAVPKVASDKDFSIISAVGKAGIFP